jgi:hypothetical protein
MKRGFDCLYSVIGNVDSSPKLRNRWDNVEGGADFLSFVTFIKGCVYVYVYIIIYGRIWHVVQVKAHVEQDCCYMYPTVLCYCSSSSSSQH